MVDPTLEKLIGDINAEIANAKLANANFTLEILCSGEKADELDFMAKDLEHSPLYKFRRNIVIAALRFRLSSGVTYLDKGETRNAAYSFDWAAKSANELRLNDLKIILLENAANLFYESGEMRSAMWAYARMAEFYAKTQKRSKKDEALKQAERIAEKLKKDPFEIPGYRNTKLLLSRPMPAHASLPVYVDK